MSSDYKTATAEVYRFPKHKSSRAYQHSERDIDRTRSATMLSIRQHLHCKASVAIRLSTFADSAPSDYCKRQANNLVRTLLDNEFGSLRVYRHRRLLIVSHKCMESLIAGILRVQFLSRQTELGEGTECQCRLSQRHSVVISWGVGDSFHEAESARVRQAKS
ncbi:MAG: hypothetical protein KTR32_02375 [Granulosicoccus sp.]|nr:hypothetical protein [Granulosicoccus sp.]